MFWLFGKLCSIFLLKLKGFENLCLYQMFVMKLAGGQTARGEDLTFKESLNDDQIQCFFTDCALMDGVSSGSSASGGSSSNRLTVF